jgi:hypothetical protein
MPTISPTISVNSTPGIEITISVPGLSYQALINMLGVIVFDITILYYYSQLQGQFFNSLQYSQYDPNGNQAAIQVVTPIDPQQYQNSELVDMDGQYIIIDGNSAVSFNMLPFNFIQFIIYAKRLQNEDAIDAAGYINNFKEVERAMGLEGFFEDSQGPLQIEFIPG